MQVMHRNAQDKSRTSHIKHRTTQNALRCSEHLRRAKCCPFVLPFVHCSVPSHSSSAPLAANQWPLQLVTVTFTVTVCYSYFYNLLHPFDLADLAFTSQI
eukprot:s164_g50.t1